jgi:hypothetical protein
VGGQANICLPCHPVSATVMVEGAALRLGVDLGARLLRGHALMAAYDRPKDVASALSAMHGGQSPSRALGGFIPDSLRRSWPRFGGD